MMDKKSSLRFPLRAVRNDIRSPDLVNNLDWINCMIGNYDCVPGRENLSNLKLPLDGFKCYLRWIIEQSRVTCKIQENLTFLDDLQEIDTSGNVTCVVDDS